MTEQPVWFCLWKVGYRAFYHRASLPNGQAKLIRYLVNHGSCKVLCHKLAGGTFRPVRAQMKNECSMCILVSTVERLDLVVSTFALLNIE